MPWMRTRDLIFAVGFLVFWIAPVLYEGVARQPLHAWLPAHFHDQYRITCLFTREHQFKLEFYVQAAARDGVWFTLPDEEYTPMQPFGYVNRNWAMMFGINNVALREHQLSLQPPRTPEEMAALEREQRTLDERKAPAIELASWYRSRYEAKHPGEPKLASVRFLSVWHPVGSEIASPVGNWRRSPVEDIPRERVNVIFQRHFAGS